MKALTLTAYHQFQFGDAPDPAPEAGDLLVRIAACGICGSDVHGMDGSSGRRIPPLIMGHEAAGTVEAAGPEAAAQGWKPGDRVTFDSTVYCGECDFCKAGRVNLCTSRNVLGVSCGDYRRHGAMAELLALPARIAHRLPDGMSFEEAAFAEPVSVALHAVSRIPVQKGDVAVVFGTGIIGLLVLQALKRAGAETVYAVDLDEGRLRLAEQLGAAAGIVSTPDAAAQIRERTGGRGADIAMEVVGISPTLKLAVESVRVGGSVGLVGNIHAEATLPLQAAVTRELTLYGSCAVCGEYPEAIAAIADGTIQVKPLISAVAPLAEGSDWFGRLYAGKEDLIKVILQP
ncbi:MAG: galactitol-1-phosphate 5-dehydrogenase [Verrucomicrobiales bacterium]